MSAATAMLAMSAAPLVSMVTLEGAEVVPAGAADDGPAGATVAGGAAVVVVVVVGASPTHTARLTRSTVALE